MRQKGQRVFLYGNVNTNTSGLLSKYFIHGYMETGKFYTFMSKHNNRMHGNFCGM